MSAEQPTPVTVRTRDGRALATREYGAGCQLVVFESGLGVSGQEWGLVAPYLGERVTAVVYDRAGYGGSDPAPGPRGVTQLAADLSDLLDHFGAQPTILVGHSLGGPIVRRYAMDHPDRVAGLVLADQSEESLEFYHRRSTTALIPIMAAVQVGMARVGIKFVPKEMRRIVDLFPPQDRPALLAELTSPKTALAARAEMVALSAGLRELRDQGDPGKLPNIPITLISGMDSASKSERALREALVAAHRALAERVPYGRHVLAERSGHMVPQDRPDLVISEIQRIVEGASSPAP